MPGSTSPYGTRSGRRSRELVALLVGLFALIGVAHAGAPADFVVENLRADVPETTTYLTPRDLERGLQISVSVSAIGAPVLRRIPLRVSLTDTVRDLRTGEMVPVELVLLDVAVSVEALGPTNLQVPLATPEFIQWAADRRDRPRSWLLQVRIDPDNRIDEGGRIDQEEVNNVVIQRVGDLVPISGELRFGPVETQLTNVDLSTDGCAGRALRLTPAATFTWSPSANGDWPVQTLSGPLCATTTVTPTGLRLEAAADVAAPVSGTLGGLPTRLGARLTPDGIAVDIFTVSLPSGHGLHASEASGRPAPAGSAQWTGFSGQVYDDVNRFSAVLDGLRWISSEGLPFSISVENLAIDANGLTGEYGFISHRDAVPFFQRDPRRSTGAPSNDNILSAWDGQTGPFVLDADGLQTTIRFDGAPTFAHFPRMTVGLPAFELAVVDGALAGMTFAPASRSNFGMVQTSDCPTCGSGALPADAMQLRSMGDAVLGTDGTLMARVTGFEAPKWGPSADHNGTPKQMFHRIGDAEDRHAMLKLPGFVATSTAAGGSVVDYLLGAHEAGEANALVVGAHHALRSAATQNGNYYQPGLTVGPEIYSDDQRQPQLGAGTDLSGTITRIGFGGGDAPDWGDVVANIGTRYVIRPGGVTGVFNTENAPQPSIYGYRVALDRFAFRLVSNVLDAANTWIDGRVAVRGAADFEVHFEGLALECSGHVGEGHLKTQDCANDVNCNQRLAAWQAPYDVSDFDFRPAGERAVCDPDPRVLHTLGAVGVAALDTPLGYSANWSPNGVATDTRITGKTRNIFDRVPGQPGFDVLLDREAALSQAQGRGWFDFAGTVPFPFWESLDASLRLQNDGPDAQQQTLVATRDGRPNAWDRNPDNAALGENMPEFDARYRWGSTDFEFSLPVKYDTRRHLTGERSRFVGKTKEYNLVVLDANAGINYITPVDTKISFGASADFETLVGLQVDLHIDLNDPQSVARIDVFLDDVFGIGGNPIASVIGQLHGLVNLLLKSTGAAFDDFLADGVDAAVDTLDGPLDAVADLLSKAQSLPATIASAVIGPLRLALEDAMADLDTEMDALALSLLQELPGVVLAARADLELGLPITDAHQQALLDAAQQLRTLAAALRNAETAFQNFESELTPARGAVTRIITDGRNYSVQATQVFDAIDTALDGFSLLSCDVNTNQILGQVQAAKTMVTNVVSALQANELFAMGQIIAAVAGIDLSLLESAQRDIAQLADDIAVRVTNAELAIEAALGCAGGQNPFETITVELRQLLTGARIPLEGLGVTLGEVETDLDAKLNYFGRIADVLGGHLGGMAGNLDGMAAELETYAQLSELPSVSESLLFGASDQSIQFWLFLAFESNLESVQFGLYWVRAQPDGTLASFVGLFRQEVFGALDNLVGGVTTEVSVRLADLRGSLPFPTQDELKAHVRGLLLNAPIIETIDRLFHENFALVLSSLDGVTVMLLDQISAFLNAALKGLESRLNDALDGATAVVNGFIEALPFESARMDGYALIHGNAIDRLHVGAEWTMRGDGDDTTTTFGGALDIISFNSSDKTACLEPGQDPFGVLDASISAFNVPLDMGEGECSLKRITLGFTLRDGAPVGAFGGLETEGELDFKSFKLFDMGLEVGLGVYETYLGAKASGAFGSVQLEAAFLLGLTCNDNILRALDPQVAEFIDVPAGVFRGGFVRGGASIPVWDNGCALTLGVGADAGSWLLWGNQGLKLGGLVGGSVWGEGLCIAAVRGKLTVLADYYDGEASFRGEGFVAAGLGFDCDPHTWTSVSRSRKDSWCGTGDAQFGASYKDGWHVDSPSTSAIH